MDEYFKLLICLIAPALTSVITVKIAFKFYNSHITKTQKNHQTVYPFSPNTSKGLAEQGYLWLSIIAPIFYFIALGLYAWQGYSISVTSEGFSEFLSISKLPIGLLSLSIPLSILVARIHATHQTSLQIAATQTQIAATQVQIAATQVKNNMDGYYAHRKAIFEYFGALKPIKYPGDIEGDFHAHPRLHLRFFKDRGPINGTPAINTPQFESTIQTLAEIQLHIHTALLRETPHTTAALNYADACDKIYSLAGKLTLPNIYDTLKNSSLEHTIYDTVNLASPNNITFTRIGNSTNELIGAYRYIRSFMRVLCEFAGHDVDFFDKKHHKIDKGGRYNAPPYSYLDIADILMYSQPNTCAIIDAQQKAKSASFKDA
jgi:hypothetical protein